MSGGWANPIPTWIGGDLTPTEQAYAALRSAAGTDSSGRPVSGAEDGLRDLWTQCKAQALGASAQSVERAMLQAFPDTMQDHLDLWEARLAVPRQPTLVERQAAVGAAMSEDIDATLGAIREALQRIDPQLDVGTMPFERAILVHQGRAFGPLVFTVQDFVQPTVGALDILHVGSTAGFRQGFEFYVAGAGFYLVDDVIDMPGERLLVKNTGAADNVAPGTTILAGAPANLFALGFSGHLFGSQWPNFSDGFVVRVSYTLLAGQVSPPEVSLRAAALHLNKVLPAWCSFQISTGATGPDGEGFYCDGGPDGMSSRLDQTALI